MSGKPKPTNLCLTGETSAIHTGATKSKPQEEVGIHFVTVTLELQQLRMLHAMRFKVAQEEKFPGMTVTILTRERKVEFLGKKKSDIEAAMVDMYDIVEKMKHSSLEMSAHLIRLMRGITMITHVVKVFKRKELCAVYVAAGDTKLEVFAPSDKDLHEAIKVIKDETREECVDAGSTDVLQTPELKEKLQSYDKGLLTITESDGRVTLSGMVDLVARAKLDILQLAEIKGSHSGRSTGSSYMLGNATVEVVQGDLTTFHTDAIVNAANGQLNHKGGLAKAIVDAGIVNICLLRNEVNLIVAIHVQPVHHLL